MLRDTIFIAFQDWTYDLCMVDSDEDGKTNGDELGDPNCVWCPGATPNRTTDLSHPGINEYTYCNRTTGTIFSP